ncbi:hypothetical protein ACFL6F_04320 [Planctomycetota bacterium]
MVSVLHAGPLRAGFLFDDPGIENIFSIRYSSHITHTADTDILITVSSDHSLKPGYSTDILSEESEQGIKITSKAIDFSFSSSNMKGNLAVSGDKDQQVDSLENALRVVFQWFAFSQGCLLMHAACAGKEGKCILFPASEGGGKTTLALLCEEQGALVYGDDLVLISISSEQDTPPCVYGVPFRGEQEFRPVPEKPGTLTEVLFIEKGKGCDISTLENAEAVARLVGNIPYIRSASQNTFNSLMVTAERIIRPGAGVFVYDLESDPACLILNRLGF